MASENTLTFTDAEFDQDVLSSDVPVLVDFWAEWCGPCRMMAPTVDAIAEEYTGKVKVGKVDVDSNKDLQGIIRFKAAFADEFQKDGVEEVSVRRQPGDGGYQMILTHSSLAVPLEDGDGSVRGEVATEASRHRR